MSRINSLSEIDKVQSSLRSSKESNGTDTLKRTESQVNSLRTTMTFAAKPALDSYNNSVRQSMDNGMPEAIIPAFGVNLRASEDTEDGTAKSGSTMAKLTHMTFAGSDVPKNDTNSS